MLLLKTFGFSANLAIYYVILTSMMEGLFIFLIIERIYEMRPAVLGTILFAFLPIDVLFSTHVQPLVPAMMFATIAVYAFIIASEGGKRRHYVYAGALAGLAYITNPISALVIIFFVLVLIARIVGKSGRPNMRQNIRNIVLLLLGFIAAYSLIGAVYLAESGNYLLYPSLTRAVYSFQEATQPQALHCLSGSLCLDYDVGYPTFYLSMLEGLPVNTIDQFARYFGISAFVLVPLAILAVLEKRRNKWALTFTLMFVFLLLSIMLFPANVSIKNGTVTYYPIDEQPYLATVLTIPLIVVTALGFDAMLKSRKALLTLIVVAIVVSSLAFDVMDLNNDVGYYRASMYTLHSFVNFVSAHPGGQYHGSFLFTSEANLISGYRYNISENENCSAAYLGSLPDNAYVVTGGTVSLDIDPGYILGFDSCAIPNMTAYSLVSTTANPLANYPGISAPNLEIFRKNA